MAEHTPTPWCYEANYTITRDVSSYDIQRQKNSAGAWVTGDASGDPYGDEEVLDYEYIGTVDRREDAARITTAVNAFHGYTGPLDKVQEGDFEALVNALEDITAACEEDCAGPITDDYDDNVAVADTPNGPVQLTFGHIRRARRLLSRLRPDEKRG